MTPQERCEAAAPAILALWDDGRRRKPLVTEWLAFVVGGDDESMVIVLPRQDALPRAREFAAAFSSDRHTATTQLETSPGPDALWCVIVDDRQFASMRVRRPHLSPGGTA